MKELFNMKFDTRDASFTDQLDLLQSRIKSFSKRGTAIKDVAVTSWQLFSNNMAVVGDDTTYVTIISSYQYDVEQQCVVGGSSAVDTLRAIWSAYGPDSTLPRYGSVPGAIDIQYTITVFTV
ncbi:hypothetical protein AH06_292 [Erwinia phage AH06]|nr:hypothetical protein AH06_292 [Erwinia phage AH06]